MVANKVVNKVNSCKCSVTEDLIIYPMAVRKQPSNSCLHRNMDDDGRFARHCEIISNILCQNFTAFKVFMYATFIFQLLFSQTSGNIEFLLFFINYYKAKVSVFVGHFYYILWKHFHARNIAEVLFLKIDTSI